MKTCPKCGSTDCIGNGSIHNGKPKYKCKTCGRQFVKNPTQRRISQETKTLIDKLLLEKISLAGIVRATGVSKRWLQTYVNKKYKEVPKEVMVRDKPKGSLTVQCDEIWSFVGQKKNKQWLWLALDGDTKEIVGLFVGARDQTGAQGLWQSLPPVYRQCAVIYTDFWKAYPPVLPTTRHRAVGKESGKTNYIERFNCTLRQRVARLVRKTLSFSKKLENHIGAIWLFVHHYNCSRP